MQESRSFGSIGQGALRFIHSISPFMARATPATINICNLCSDTQISAGNCEASPARTAPKPRLTSKAGRAQQMRVLIEVNNDKKLKNEFFVLVIRFTFQR